MPGGVGAGTAILPATRLAARFIVTGNNLRCGAGFRSWCEDLTAQLCCELGPAEACLAEVMLFHFVRRLCNYLGHVNRCFLIMTLFAKHRMFAANNAGQ